MRVNNSDYRAESVTIDWCEERWSDSSVSYNMKRYEICDSVRIVFQACVGGWSTPAIWVGKHERDEPTKGDIEDLCGILGVECKVIWPAR